ncbi:MAG: tetratricopeptide repeat protein [Actinomycetia bacterium]|nr:tetratricopeptide repeat protein [Actinomycetes bacterium]
MVEKNKESNKSKNNPQEAGRPLSKKSRPKKKKTPKQVKVKKSDTSPKKKIRSKDNKPMAKTIIVSCQNVKCSSKLKIPVSKKPVKIRCPVCKNIFDYDHKYENVYKFKGKYFFNYLSNDYLLNNKFEEAIKLSTKKTEVAPDDEYSFYALGISFYSKLINLYSDIGLLRNKAIDAFLKTIEINPQNPSPHISLMLISMSSGNYVKSIEDGENFLKIKDRIKTEDSEIHKLIAESYSLSGNTKSAKKFYEKAVDEYPDILDVHFRLADIYLKENKNEEALAEYKKEIEATFKNPRINYDQLKLVPSFLISFLKVHEIMKKMGKSKSDIDDDETLKRVKSILNLSDKEISEQLKKLM